MHCSTSSYDKRKHAFSIVRKRRRESLFGREELLIDTARIPRRQSERSHTSKQSVTLELHQQSSTDSRLMIHDIPIHDIPITPHRRRWLTSPLRAPAFDEVPPPVMGEDNSRKTLNAVHGLLHNTIITRSNTSVTQV